jgi:hypothetical protein
MADNTASSEITLIVKSQDGAEMQFKGAIPRTAAPPQRPSPRKKALLTPQNASQNPTNQYIIFQSNPPRNSARW